MGEINHFEKNGKHFDFLHFFIRINNIGLLTCFTLIGNK